MDHIVEYHDNKFNRTAKTRIKMRANLRQWQGVDSEQRQRIFAFTPAPPSVNGTTNVTEIPDQNKPLTVMAKKREIWQLNFVFPLL